MSVRVLLVDDHTMLREGLRAVLAGERDVEVVGEAATGREALEKVRELAPDVVLMDVTMHDLNGVEATRQIRRESPRTRVVALSTHGDKRYVLGMLDAGAVGYVLKVSAYDELRRAIRTAVAGKVYLSPEIADVVVAARRARGEFQEPSGLDVLGAREREVLQLLAEGHTSGEIAQRLGVSTSTVETHRRNIMRKLDLHSVAELTKFAIREGLTPLDA